MSLLGNLFNSSIGRKFLMAVSGLVLVGFVVGHLVGNLQIFAAPDQINGYAHFLQSLGPTLWVARGLLLVMVVIHIWAAVVLTIDNRKARGAQDYEVKKWIQASVASRYMRWTGIVVLAFIVYHLAHFTVGVAGKDTFKTAFNEYEMTEAFHITGFPVVERGTPVHDVYSMVFLGFQNPIVSLFYIVAVGLLAVHLLHGFDSMFQTLGWRNYRWSGALRKITVLFCLAYFLGNLAIPGAILTGLLKPAPGTVAAKQLAAAPTAQR
ncbi:MAG: succinate dehydrogenase cytochrome b subunit [Opitutaceae bacterium]|nr:succinate dehydrogenase cytochrome b subunit [Opitutaceae bacterium]